jgi:hypothetical protein
MAVTGITITRQENFADGATFGRVGGYEKIVGTLRGTLDPANAANTVISGLDRAPRNAAGLVEYETDFYLLAPARGSGKLLFDVNNRGNKPMLHMFCQVPAGPDGNINDPCTLADIGDALPFRRGYAMAWAGWDPDAPRRNHGLSIRIPALLGEEAEIRDEFVSAARSPAIDRFRLSYRVVTDAPVKLTKRFLPGDTPVEIAWRFADDRTIELLPEGTRPEVGQIYEVTYRGRDPWVSGIAYAAQRDVVAFLRSDAEANPLRGTIRKTIGFGISQSGRFLRDFVRLGFNRDEAGQKVFDGVFAHTGGIGGVFLNHPFAQPNRTRSGYQDRTMPENFFPFATAATRDPATGIEDALLRQDGFDPLLIHTNTSTEYWQKGASLLSTDPEGVSDLDLPETTRLYLIAGTQHAGRAGAPSSPGNCQNARNPHSAAPALRALLVAMDAWVTDGTPPPPSLIPRIDDRTLVRAEALNFPRLPSFAVATAATPVEPIEDWVHPVQAASPYGPMVPAVDDDGNEIAGIRLPDIAVPAATFTGWNLFRAPFPACELCDRDGSWLPFALTEADRDPADPRPSLAARHAGPVAYSVAMRAAADALVAQRLLLEEDAYRYVAATAFAFQPVSA